MPVSAPVTSRPFRLGLLLFPGCMPAGLFSTADLVRACNLRAGRELMTATWVGVDEEMARARHGPELRVESTLVNADCDALLLPGLWLASTDALEGALRTQQPLIDALRVLPASTQIWSYCAGVALAAAAGRLDGETATATWWLRPALSNRFKRVAWTGESDLLFGERAATAAGPSGYLPLMLDRLGRHFTADVLRDVQELLMLPIPRPRHAAFQAVEMMALEDTSMRTLLQWAQRTPAQDVTLAAAAKQTNVSVRTLCRQIQRATGLAAGDWLRRAKLCQAADALRGTRSPIKTISDDLGFGGEASFYRAFRATTGLTPSAYRQAFGVATRVAPVSNA